VEKTTFAGLTVLDEDESILTDGGTFIGRDRKIIDRLLEIGVKTHRHDGSDGLGNPLQGIGASATGSAGQLPADLTFSLGYTLEDDQLGETLISPLTVISTPPVIERPLVAPAGVADYTAGSLLTDTYYYAISYVDGTGGETPIGPAIAVERHSGEALGRILLSGLTSGMAAAGATGWRLYRAVGGGDFHYLATGVVDNYTDDGSTPVQPDITPLTDSENTTNSDNGLLLHLPSADGRIAPASFINVYLSEDGSFSGPSFLDQFPVGSAGRDAFYPTVTLENAQPPDTNNSVGGASLIDPDSELYDWHWKRPVQLASQLPSGTKGDVRLVHGASAAYYLPNDGAGSAAWQPIGVERVGRLWASATVPALASGASASITFAPSAAGMRLLKLSTNKRARVRMYGDTAARAADVARGIGTDPTGDHGVLLDYANTTTASGGLRRLSPQPDMHNLDEPAAELLYLNITNYDATGDLVVGMLYIPTEVL
jgi:hypothetical protein